MKRSSWWICLLVWLLVCSAPATAFAWTEARPSGLSTEVAIDRDGAAIVSLRVRWTVLGGRMHQFDVAELPTDHTLLEASAVAGNGAVVPVATRAPAPDRIEVTLGDETRGVRRGTVDVLIRYATSLRAQGAIRSAGDEAVIEVATVPWGRAIEGVELRVVLPLSVRRAQWISDAIPGVQSSNAVELSRDVVRAVRGQLPANERWVARVAADPRVFPWLTRNAAQRVVTVRRARPAYATTLALCAGLLLSLGLLAHALRRSGHSPPHALRLLAIAATGLVLQSLHAMQMPGALTLGTLALAIATLRALPAAPIAVGAIATRVVARTVSERDLARLAPMRMLRLRAVALTIALAAVVALVLAATQANTWASVIATDLAMASLAGAVWISRSAPSSTLAALWAVGRRVHVFARWSARCRIAWRVRGDLCAGGALSFRVVPLPGWRLSRGLRAIECACEGEGVQLRVRFEVGAPVERPVRMLATRVGHVVMAPDGEAAELRVDLVAVDEDVALEGLRAMLDEMFVKAPRARSAERHDAADVSDDRATT